MRNPLRLAAEGIPHALRNLASMRLVVAASSLADGRNEFVALTWFDDASVSKHAFAAEGALSPALFALAPTATTPSSTAGYSFGGS